MASNNTQQATKPKPKPQQQHYRTQKPNTSNNRHQHQQKNFVRKVPPRAPTSNRHNIYINTKTDFKAQLKRCEELLNSEGIKEIYLHCLGYAITTGINLALQLTTRSSGVLDYAINTSTIHLIDELHPLCDADDISLRPRNNSALHIKIFNKNALLTEKTVAQKKQLQQQDQLEQQQQQRDLQSAPTGQPKQTQQKSQPRQQQRNRK